MYKLRPYQQDAVNNAVEFLQRKDKKNGVIVISTAGGKSIIIAEVVKRLHSPVVIFCPTLEILTQNYAKYTSYGFPASIYSASKGEKIVSDVTFVTIGSVVNKPELFGHIKYCIADECHLWNPKGGMYESFFKAIGSPKLVGFSATPYRLSTDNWGGSILKFITRTRPRIFDTLVYYVQNKTLFDAGYLAKLKYYSIPGFDSNKLKLNTTGADYTEGSIQKYYTEINFPASIIRVVTSLLKVRKNALVFTRFVSEAEYLVANIPGFKIITADTKKKEREQIIKDFDSGALRGLANVGVLVTGVDFPKLETVVIACPTMSLARWYQMIGRGMRIHETKEDSWIVDMGDNLRLFGRVEDMMIEDEGNGKYFISSNGKKLTNKYYER